MFEEHSERLQITRLRLVIYKLFLVFSWTFRVGLFRREIYKKKKKKKSVYCLTNLYPETIRISFCGAVYRSLKSKQEV